MNGVEQQYLKGVGGPLEGLGIKGYRPETNHPSDGPR